MAIKRYAGDRFTGLSTDVKPTDVQDGAVFDEIDTYIRYIRSGGQWVDPANPPAPPGYSTEYQAVLDYANAEGIATPSATQNTINNNIIEALKTANWFQTAEIFYYFAQEAGLADFCRINWKDPNSFYLEQTDPSLVPAYIEGKGFKRDVAGKFFNTGYNRSIHAVNATHENSSIIYKFFDIPNSSPNQLLGGRGNSGEGINIRNNGTGQLMQRHNNDWGLNYYNTGGSQSELDFYSFLNNHSPSPAGQKRFVNGILKEEALGPYETNINHDIYILGLDNRGALLADGTAGISYFGYGAEIDDPVNGGEIYEALEGEKDIIVEMGQSNMEGRDGDSANPDYPFNSDKGFYFNGSEESLISTDRGDAEGGSHANYFAAKYNELSGKKAILIEVAASGAGLTTTSKPDPDNWSSSGSLRSTTETRVSNALTYYDKTAPKAGVWCQGERDAQEMDSNGSYTKAIVKSAMQDVIDWWQTTYPGVPFLISETGDFDTMPNTQGWQDMRAVQNEIVTENTNVFMAFTGAKTFGAEGKMVDSLHYNYTGYSEMGEAFAQAIIDES